MKRTKHAHPNNLRFTTHAKISIAQTHNQFCNGKLLMFRSLMNFTEMGMDKVQL